MDFIFLKVLSISIIQGVMEWVPISSSGLLIVLEEILNMNNKIFNLNLNITVHFGSLFAVLFFFSKEITKIFNNRKLLLNIFVATLPIILIGAIFKLSGFIYILQNTSTVISATLIFAVILFLCDQKKVKNKFNKNLPYQHAIVIGLAQVAALIPGSSRSGVTISAARYLGYSRVDAAKFSFLISIPTIFGANILNLSDTKIDYFKDDYYLLIVAFLVSFIVSFYTIKYFLNFLQKFSLNIFVIIRIILGIYLAIFFI